MKESTRSPEALSLQYEELLRQQMAGELTPAAQAGIVAGGERKKRALRAQLAGMGRERVASAESAIDRETSAALSQARLAGRDRGMAAARAILYERPENVDPAPEAEPATRREKRRKPGRPRKANREAAEKAYEDWKASRLRTMKDYFRERGIPSKDQRAERRRIDCGRKIVSRRCLDKRA